MIHAVDHFFSSCVTAAHKSADIIYQPWGKGNSEPPYDTGADEEAAVVRATSSGTTATLFNPLKKTSVEITVVDAPTGIYAMRVTRWQCFYLSVRSSTVRTERRVYDRGYDGGRQVYRTKSSLLGVLSIKCPHLGVLELLRQHYNFEHDIYGDN